MADERRRASACRYRLGFELSATIITLEITVCFRGTFDGTWVGTERDVFRADGTGTVHGSGVFSGTVNGRSGTMAFSYHVTISRNGEVTRWVVNQGTGDLAGLSGQGTFQNDIEHGPGCPGSGFDCTDCPPQQVRATTRLPLLTPGRSTSLHKPTSYTAAIRNQPSRSAAWRLICSGRWSPGYFSVLAPCAECSCAP